MTGSGSAALMERIREFVGRETPSAGSRDPVNLPMIRHWCDALGDANPNYTDPDRAARSPHRGIVAPPTMLQAWTLQGLGPRPETTGPDVQASVLGLLDEAGFTSVVATNCEQEYHRYLALGDSLTASIVIDSVSDEKKTALGTGHFVNETLIYRDQRGEPVATMRFRLLKFRPPEARAGAGATDSAVRKISRPRPAITHDNAFFWEGVAAGELRIQRCQPCGRLRHPPGPMCPSVPESRLGHGAVEGARSRLQLRDRASSAGAAVRLPQSDRACRARRGNAPRVEPDRRPARRRPDRHAGAGGVHARGR